MSGYCGDCGNTLCICREVAADKEERERNKHCPDYCDCTLGNCNTVADLRTKLDSELEILRSIIAALTEERRAFSWSKVDLETLIQNEHKLYADAHERMLQAEKERDELREKLRALEEWQDVEVRVLRKLLARVESYEPVIDAAKAWREHDTEYAFTSEDDSKCECLDRLADVVDALAKREDEA